jgi:phosphate transport system permease protein
MGRAIGETMAMIMVIGNSIIIPDSIFSPARTLTGTLALELKYAAGLHWNALFATGVVLFVFILILNSFGFLMLRGKNK